MRITLSKLTLSICVVLLVTASFPQSVPLPSTGSSGITFTKVDVPGATATAPTGINNSGTIVGQFADSSGVFHGFLADKEGAVTATIDFPGAAQTEPSGINEKGDVVGSYANDDGIFHGFILQDGNFITSDVPGSIATFPFDINDQGVVAGGYVDAEFFTHGFTLDQTGFHTVDNPAQGSVLTTELFAINSRGDSLGDFAPDAFGIFHGAFLLSHGEFVPFTVPQATRGLFAFGLNDSGEVAGSFLGDDFVQHGFLEDNGAVISFDFPGALATAPIQMNASRHIVGIYADQAVNTRGFLITFDGQRGTNTAAAPASPVLTPPVTADQVTVCGSVQATSQNNIVAGQKLICHQ